ncbi:terminase [Vallitalea longa]|uniref:Terminase n=1 Tax=Vallitalea longa TaxID=2936439 RepID=A0A9W5Y8B6_9FIRM|nr:terminase TerL endonuclease subunit [Vallitalea longa]GKX29020.1 terminase [Vallitalea longa]
MIDVNLTLNTINNEHSYLLEYYNKAIKGLDSINCAPVDIKSLIENGEIVIIGQELMTCLENLINDLDNPDYYYDNSIAELRIEFIETFCKHTKSPFYGKPFLLELWEKALIEVIYSFRWSETGLRRFKKVILLIGRKNGKSAICGALSMAEFMCGNGGSDLICSSNDDNQASIIYDEINTMREMFDPKEKRTHKNQKGIFNLITRSSIKKLSDRTRNKEGRNIDFAILDESHEMKDNIIAKSIEQSQSTKDEPLFINITTEGFINDGYLDEELRYGREVLNGEREDPDILVWLYTQDSEEEIFQDELTWYKANPNLGVCKKRAYLVSQIRSAQAKKSDRVFVLAKDFNVKQTSATRWLEESDINNDATFDYEEFRGYFGFSSTDLSETTDLTSSKVLIMKPNSNKKYIIQKYFIPESKLNSKEAPYREWVEAGYVTKCEGNDIDYSKITQWHEELRKKYKIRIFKAGCDKWNAKYWRKEMDEKLGIDVENVPMDKYTLSNPMKSVEADFKDGLIIYNNNPVDRWCFLNTCLKVDKEGLIYPIKSSDVTQRIDGSVTLIILYVLLKRYRTEYMNIT